MATTTQQNVALFFPSEKRRDKQKMTGLKKADWLSVIYRVCYEVCLCEAAQAASTVA